MDGFHRLLKHYGVVGVRQQIAVVEHGDPRLAIGDHLGGKGILEHLTGHHHRKHEAISFHIVFRGFPSQLKAVIETSDHPFLLQLVQGYGAIHHRLAQ